MPRRGPDPDRVREAMAHEAEVVQPPEPPASREHPPAAEPDVLPEQLEADHDPPDSDDPAVGPVHES